MGECTTCPYTKRREPLSSDGWLRCSQNPGPAVLSGMAQNTAPQATPPLPQFSAIYTVALPALI